LGKVDAVVQAEESSWASGSSKNLKRQYLVPAAWFSVIVAVHTVYVLEFLVQLRPVNWEDAAFADIFVELQHSLVLEMTIPIIVAIRAFEKVAEIELLVVATLTLTKVEGEACYVSVGSLDPFGRSGLKCYLVARSLDDSESYLKDYFLSRRVADDVEHVVAGLLGSVDVGELGRRRQR
jgi:hypothetical protein